MNENITLIIGIAGIAGIKPAILHRTICGIRIVPIALHIARRLDENFTDLPDRNLAIILINNFNLDAGIRFAARPQFTAFLSMVGCRQMGCAARRLG